MPAMGGTELTKKWLYENIEPQLLEGFAVVSRPEDYVIGAQNILWVHDLPADMQFMASPRIRKTFAGIVFVSSWQQTIFAMNMGVPYSESTVIRNAINPITVKAKSRNGQVRLVYHPTPHRGLELLVPAFIDICKHDENLHLDVFSNFDIYDRHEANAGYELLYEQCRNHPNITYHGTQDNETVRTALADAHIFAYPSIWRETSCISAIEAMSAKCLVVAPMYAALAETVGPFGFTYPWTENLTEHSQRFTEKLCDAISAVRNDSCSWLLDKQKDYVDTFYSWQTRKHEWERYLSLVPVATRRLKQPGVIWN